MCWWHFLIRLVTANNNSDLDRIDPQHVITIFIIMWNLGRVRRKKKVSRSLQTIDYNIPCQSKISVGHFFYHSNKLLNNGFILCRNKHVLCMLSRKIREKKKIYDSNLLRRTNIQNQIATMMGYGMFVWIKKKVSDTYERYIKRL